MIVKYKILKLKEMIMLIAVPLCFGLYSIMLGQDTNWDLLNYHLYNPYSFLNNRLGFDLAPAGLQTYFNPFLDVLYLWATGCWSPRVVGFMLGVIHGINFVILFYICKHTLKSLKISNNLSLLLAMAGILSIGFLSEVGTTFHDNIGALFCLLSVLVVVLSINSILENKKRAIWGIVLSGLVIGLGAGCKLVIAIYAMAICFSFFILPVSLINRLKFSVIFGVAVLLGLSLTEGYWFYKIWDEFGNPFFPQFNHIFSGDLAQSTPMRDFRFLPKSFWEKLIYPLIFTIYPRRVAEHPYIQINWLILYVTVIIFLSNRLINFFRMSSSFRSLSPEANFLIAYLCLGYLLWLNIFGIYRYIINLELLLPLVLFIVLTTIIKSKWSPKDIAIIIMVMSFVNVIIAPDWGHAPWAKKTFYITSQDIQNKDTKIVFLAGQPLAWLIPALNTNAHFIQLIPNFSVSDAYWRRAQSFISDGDYYVILGRGKKYSAVKVDERLHKIGLFLNRSTCKTMDAYLGATVIQYNYCKVQKELRH